RCNSSPPSSAGRSVRSLWTVAPSASSPRAAIAARKPSSRADSGCPAPMNPYGTTASEVNRATLGAPMAHQYIFQMHRLTKAFPPDKTVLKDITLAFLPGAKIGVLGYNGAGKSTVLNIMAGRETEFRGDAMLAPDATVGLLEQEPHLDEGKDVRGNVEDGI